ncbi:MAG: HisA/HisF-related TIM barrel protein [Rubripirellula sp.]|nr:HisA/HisF-related TIM barrel protein [Rubripirellula sp.]
MSEQRAWSGKELAALVGVIDLLDGSAVHAIAGQRSSYRPVLFCDGDPHQLLDHYLSHDVKSVYIADLSAIQHRTPNWKLLRSLVSHPELDCVWLDIGWRGTESDQAIDTIRQLVDLFPTLQFIAASESCEKVGSLRQLANYAGATRTWLGLDYRDGKLLGCESKERTWIDTATELNAAGFVILDLAAVGTRDGSTTKSICRRVRQRSPSLKILSGGGVRHAEDSQRLHAAGCDKILVATALQP